MPDLVRTRAHLEQGLGNNLWTGYALALRRPGIIDEFAGGDVSDPSASVPWFSAGKPVTAVGVLRILETSSQLEKKPLEETFPELAGSYAATLTLDDLLSHQTGLRVAETSLRDSPGRIFEFFRGLKPEDCKLFPHQAAYDPAGGWWLLGQWIERHTGQPWEKYLEQKILLPAGIRNLGYHPATVPIRERRAGRWMEADPGSGPGAGLTGPASQLALFYENLVANRLLSSPSLKKMLQPVRSGKMDATFGHVIDFGLGVILNSNRHGVATVPYGFGTGAGDRAFGHGGARSSIAFADPEAGFTAAIFLNGRVPETEHQPRMRTLLDLLRSELV